jgi:hypothetical protein
MCGDRSCRRYSLFSVKLYKLEANNGVQQGVKRFHLAVKFLHYVFQIRCFQFLPPALPNVMVAIVSCPLVHEGHDGRIQESGRGPYGTSPLLPAPQQLGRVT